MENAMDTNIHEQSDEKRECCVQDQETRPEKAEANGSGGASADTDTPQSPADSLKGETRDGGLSSSDLSPKEDQVAGTEIGKGDLDSGDTKSPNTNTEEIGLQPGESLSEYEARVIEEQASREENWRSEKGKTVPNGDRKAAEAQRAYEAAKKRELETGVLDYNPDEGKYAPEIPEPGPKHTDQYPDVPSEPFKPSDK